MCKFPLFSDFYCGFISSCIPNVLLFFAYAKNPLQRLTLMVFYQGFLSSSPLRSTYSLWTIILLTVAFMGLLCILSNHLRRLSLILSSISIISNLLRIFSIVIQSLSLMLSLIYYVYFICYPILKLATLIHMLRSFLNYPTLRPLKHDRYYIELFFSRYWLSHNTHAFRHFNLIWSYLLGLLLFLYIYV